MHDFMPIKSIDHLEFYVGNARQAAHYYRTGFGFTVTAYSGLETGNRELASYVLEQGNIRFVLTSPQGPDNAIARFVHLHGDGVGVIALEVPDVERAYQEATKRGATGAIPPKEVGDADGVIQYASIHCYGDVLIRFIDRSKYKGVFVPSFQPMAPLPAAPNGHNGNGSHKRERRHKGLGLAAVDHMVGNVELGAMNRWVKFFADTMGFSQLQEFGDDDIATEYSALMSKVMQDGTGKVKFPINEPAEGKKKSQVQEYLDFNYAPGVQHVALSTGDIIATVTQLQANGIEFLRVPDNYYQNLSERIGKIDEPLDELARLGVLIDRDDEGYLLQIFSKPVQDRPTVFFEIIERHGSRGFGKGNFKALFESLEREQALRGNL